MLACTQPHIHVIPLLAEVAKNYIKIRVGVVVDSVFGTLCSYSV